MSSDKSYVRELVNAVGKLTIDVDEAYRTYERAEKKEASLRKELERITATIKQWNSAITEQNKKKTGIERKIRHLERDITQLEADQERKPSSKLTSQLKQKNKDLTAQETDLESRDSSIATCWGEHNKYELRYKPKNDEIAAQQITANQARTYYLGLEASLTEAKATLEAARPTPSRKKR